jgi:membrane carboxypeptidase/penicillin-binding protein
MTMRIVDPTTGMLANEWCPVKEHQYFKPGTEPTEICNVHTEQQQDQPPPDDMALPPDPVKRAAEGIGSVLRRIFHF